MNIYSDLLMKTDEKLRLELKELKCRHRGFDSEISSFQESSAADQLAIKRMKMEKLRLKDTVIWIEDRIYPDIIA